MAYTKQNWECGDLITADKMNHIEDGIEDASSGGTESLIVTTTATRAATTEECANGGRAIELSHSWQEIHDAMALGKPVFLSLIVGYAMVLSCTSNSGYFIAIAVEPGSIDSWQFVSSASKVVVQCNGV